VALNFQIITALQTEVEGRLFARPGVYDGRKNLFTSFDLEFEAGAHEASVLYCYSYPLLNAFFSMLCPWATARRAAIRL
jgi:hypothetical protein